MNYIFKNMNQIYIKTVHKIYGYLYMINLTLYAMLGILL